MKDKYALMIAGFVWVVAWLSPLWGFSQGQILQQAMQHVRNAGDREWSSFPQQADRSLRLSFPATAGVTDCTLQLTQADVKQLWRVQVNDVEVGALIQDENRLTTYLNIPSSALKANSNVLVIRSDAPTPDDILVGDIRLHYAPVDDLMSAIVDITILGDGKDILPGKITIINDSRSLQTVFVDSARNIALRPGCIYTPHAVAVRIPAGRYVFYAGRGFEYSVDSVVLTVAPGQRISHAFTVRREVDTKGWISSDPHVHTYTHSKHGDASMRERVITLAGEGIDMPVMTDHNVYVDLWPYLDSIAREDPNVRMTPVVGNEVTTAVGHFNVLNIPKQAAMIDHRGVSWQEVGKAITTVTSGSVVILNHARDVHNRFRPFDPARHLSSVGMDRDDWRLPANAMEVINSGSQQSDYMQLFRDWFGMLNAGNRLTPIGSSDSHDVNRYIVGQGRTYIKGEYGSSGEVDVANAMHALADGKVMVSCGLLVKILVNNAYGPGDMAKGTDRIAVDVEVLGPAWSNADSVVLYMNGLKVKEAGIAGSPGKPIAERFSWEIEAPKHDVFFAAVAQGHVKDIPFWRIAKPYQPATPVWTPWVYAGTGAVWVDCDRNNKQESAAAYASGLVMESKGSMTRLMDKLASYDEAVAMATAALLWKRGTDLRAEKVQSALRRSKDHVRRGFATVMDEVAQISQ